MKTKNELKRIIKEKGYSIKKIKMRIGEIEALKQNIDKIEEGLKLISKISLEGEIKKDLGERVEEEERTKAILLEKLNEIKEVMKIINNRIKEFEGESYKDEFKINNNWMEKRKDQKFESIHSIASNLEIVLNLSFRKRLEEEIFIVLGLVELVDEFEYYQIKDILKKNEVLNNIRNIYEKDYIKLNESEFHLLNKLKRAISYG